MSDIKKKLILSAELDTSKLRSKLSNLQKDMQSKGQRMAVDPSMQKQKEEQKAWKQYELEQKRTEREKNIAWKQRQREKQREQLSFEREVKRQKQVAEREEQNRQRQLSREKREQERREAREKSNLNKQVAQKRQEWISDPRRTVASSEERKQFFRDQSSGRFDKSNEKDYLHAKGLRESQRQQKQKEAENLQKKQETERKVAQYRKNLQKQVDSDNEKRQLGIVYRVSEAFKNYLRTGSFDFLQKSQQGGFRREAGRAGISGLQPRMGRMGRIAGAGGAMALRAAGAVGLGVGALYAGSNFARGAFETQRQQREELARARFEQANLINQDRVLEAPIRRGARGRLSVFQRGTAGISGFLGGLMRGAPMQGARAAIAEEGRREGDVAAQESGPLLNAVQNTLLPNVNTRLQTMAGGNMSPSQLNTLQYTGGSFGFGIQESNQRLQELRQTLGGRSFTGAQGDRLFGDMLGLERRMGIGAGEQAQFMEMLRGTQSGNVPPERAFLQQKEIIKTAMASGLDASKVGKSLQTTSEYITSNAGFANMDASAIASSISELSASFADSAGRNTVTENDLARARRTRQLLREESTSTGGISGIGNFIAIQRAAEESGVQLDTRQFMAMQNVSSDATVDQISQVLQMQGMSKKDASAFAQNLFQNRQEGSFRMGAEALGGTSTALAFSGERGLTTEQNAALMRARERQDGVRDRIDRQLPGTELPTGALGTKEMVTQTQRVNVELVNFGESFKNITTINDQYRQGVLELVKALGTARESLESLVPGSTTTRTTSPQAPRQDDGESSARSTRSIGPAISDPWKGMR